MAESKINTNQIRIPSEKTKSDSFEHYKIPGLFLTYNSYMIGLYVCGCLDGANRHLSASFTAKNT